MTSAGMRQYALVKAVEAAFDTIVDRINVACDIYRQQDVEAWALHASRPDANWLANALLDFWYSAGQDGRATRAYVGLIAASPELFTAIHEVNDAKRSFHEILQEIKAVDNKMYSPLKGSLLQRHPDVKRNMEGAGLARLNLKQAWRHIPVVETPVRRVHFSWYSSGRSIKRLSVQEAERQLLAIGGDKPHIQIQLKLLAGIPSSETLAQIQPQSPLMRANVFYEEGAEPERSAMNVALPLFVQPQYAGILPPHNTPSPLPSPRQRVMRKDAKIEDDPFLRSIRVHRYRDVSKETDDHRFSAVSMA